MSEEPQKKKKKKKKVKDPVKKAGAGDASKKKKAQKPESKEAEGSQRLDSPEDLSGEDLSKMVQMAHSNIMADPLKHAPEAPKKKAKPKKQKTPEQEGETFQAAVDSLLTTVEKGFEGHEDEWEEDKELMQKGMALALKSTWERFFQGHGVLLEQMGVDPSSESSPYLPGPEAREVFADSERFSKAIEEEGSLAGVFGFTAESMADFLGAAVALFNGQDYEKALDGFHFLSVLEPREVVYWINVAACYEKLEKVEEAIQAYYGAVRADPLDFIAYARGVRYALEVGNEEAARTFGDILEGLMGNQDVELEETFRAQAVEIVKWVTDGKVPPLDG